VFITPPGLRIKPNNILNRSTMKIGAVINNSSGTLSPEEAKNRLEIIKQNLENRVAEGCLSVVEGSEVEEEVERLLSLDIDLLVIGGGDGTVSTGARHVADTDIPLLVLALGTKNNFAGDAGIPEDPESAIHLLDQMVTRKIDVGKVNGHIFINNATLGLYPNIVTEREEKTDNHGWSKWRAKIGAVMVVLKRIPLIRMTIESKDFRVKLFTPFLFVGNNEYKNITTSEVNRPSLNKGKLWLCMSKSPRFWSLLKMAWQLSFNSIKETENLSTHLLTDVQVKPRKRNVKVAIDGENTTLKTPLQFKIRSKSLQIVVP
jgi:diacylglycerol kinase family enzyme